MTARSIRPAFWTGSVGVTFLSLTLVSACGGPQQPAPAGPPAMGEGEVAAQGAFDDYDQDAAQAPAPRTAEDLEAARKAYSPFAGKTYPRHVYFGDTHHHTANSGIKGWVDAKGEPQDKVIDVVWSGDRKPGRDGKLPPVGNTVDVQTATYANTIGSAELMGTWADPEFDPTQPALYYVRVLEIPTPRFTTYDAVRNNLPLLPDVPATVQERAWTSPIWYTPK